LGHHALVKTYEASLGEDLSDVGLVFGPIARCCCAALGSAAFTAGSTIFFAEEPADVSDGAFRELLSHELVHVVQNRRRVAGVWRSRPQDDAELEAAELAPHIASGRRVKVTCGPAGVLQGAAAAPAWPQTIRNLDELKSWMDGGAYTEAQTVLRDLSPADRASFGKAINELYKADADLTKKVCRLLRSLAGGPGQAMTALVVRELQPSSLPDVKAFVEALDQIGNKAHWLQQMVEAATVYPIPDADKAALWLATARGGWMPQKALKEYKKVNTVTQGSPVLSPSGFIRYWDFLSRNHTALTDGNKWATSVMVPLAVGSATVWIPGHKIIHYVEGHTLKYFKTKKSNFTRSRTTRMMSFWPPVKKTSAIVNDARTALLNNAGIRDELAKSAAEWPVGRDGGGIDVDNPYPLHLGFHRKNESEFNLTQFYPNVDAAAGNTAILLHEEMVIAVFSVLLDLG
jgi:hypothetical protein